MALHSIRSERQLVERIDADLLFCWFLGMTPDDPAFDATTFTHNRPRLDAHGLTAAFFDAVLTSDDHFSVDGTLIESYASIKSFLAPGRTASRRTARSLRRSVPIAATTADPFCLELETRGVEPHVAMLATPPPRRSTFAPLANLPSTPENACESDWRARAIGSVSAVARKIEECFGWIKHIAGLARSRCVGRWKILQ